MAKKQLTALGGAIYAGLFTKGVEQAGFKLLGHLEHVDYGVRTAKLNYPNLDIRVGIHNWKPDDFKGKVDFMYCNPPCAVWSSMRSKVGGHPWQTDQRLNCVTSLVDAGLLIRPKAWCWESVTNAWRHGKDFVLEQAHRWTDAGYQVTVLLQDNQFLGVPQRRQRMFLIAHQHPLVWPELTKTTTVAQALKKAPKRVTSKIATPALSPFWQELWKRSDAHRGRLRTTYESMETHDIKRLNGGGAPLAVTQRLRPDEPAPVMLASFTRLHPTEPRMLTWGEWLALCGLPADWQTAERGFDAATRELARAVMPPVGRWLGTAVKDGIEASRPLRRTVEARLVDLRDPQAPATELLYRHPWRDTAPAVEWSPPLPTLVERKRIERGPSTPRGPRLGSGYRTRVLLLAGRSTAEILATIKSEFPESKATSADVSWNRRKLRLQDNHP